MRCQHFFCMASGCLPALEVGCLMLGAQVHIPGYILLLLNYSVLSCIGQILLRRRKCFLCCPAAVWEQQEE